APAVRLSWVSSCWSPARWRSSAARSGSPADTAWRIWVRLCSPAAADRSRISSSSAHSSPWSSAAQSPWARSPRCYPPCSRIARSWLRILRHCLRAWASERVRATLAASLCLVSANFGLTPHGQSAFGGAVARLTFAQLVDSIRANFEVTQTMKSLNGKDVEIHGFIIPAGPPDLSFFLLSRVSAMGNYCCEVPVGQDETVYVVTAKGVKIFYDPLRVYKVRGVFEAGMHSDKAYGVSLF